ncbi:T9SS type A sorting domain-containing protein [Reichenbachiella ulvae]|uniref:T9SS type A sorting domain-containing protein n=1 Tax=Reichenbachiella ulvae TaxID=2980104 RepID=A0ABT3CND5_9BACT|nr:T9SS type A sorting domain-containing protein [Reichenbachiella ulvae]MCV9385250.1 T9SS type A sorting domain-containing protein [Reichenbachiella ulvae]
MKYYLLYILIVCFYSVQAQNIELPVEVLGAEGSIASRTFELTESQASSVESLWMQVNNLSYENKASISINDGIWMELNHESVVMQYQEKARGGMTHGGFSTIRFSIPIKGIVAGSNTIQFRFNRSDGISIGYRVVKFNLLDASGAGVIDDSLFVEEDPMNWTSPIGYDDAASIAAGKDLWENAGLWSNYLNPDTVGSWYGYELLPATPIQATCGDCHVSNGYDLEYFSYSNESIIERAKFHKLSEDEGKKLAAYIRSLSSEPEGPQRYGRPWNPPYQPGPELADKSLSQWAAGAGLEAILDKDEDMLSYMFPSGVDSLSVAEYFDNDRVEDHTLMPLAVHLPDWKHWLPLVHPKDAFAIDDYYQNPTVDIHPKIGWERIKNYLDAAPIESRNMEDFKNELHIFHRHFRHFFDQASGEVRHWRTAGDAIARGTYNEVSAHIPEGIPVEMTVTSLARLLAVKNFEIMNLYDLQDKNEWFVIPEDYDELTPRRWQWLGSDYNIFEVPPHFTSCATNSNCDNFIGQSIATGNYESTAWYQLQLVLNGGNGNVGGNDPMDWQYQLSFILRASASSGIYEPVRLYHSLNAMYQLRTYEKHKTPNKNGFRARQQMPHWFYGLGDSNDFYGFAPGYFSGLLDEIQPGMRKLFLDALLSQFLQEVSRPEMNLSSWNRKSPNGGSYELEPADHSEALANIESQIGLYYYVDKMYYLLPKFAEAGVDCRIIDQLSDWCAEAWPNYDWEQFKSISSATVLLKTNENLACGEYATEFVAIGGNQGSSPRYEWWVNGTKMSTDASTYTDLSLSPGDQVTVHMTSNRDCVDQKVATAQYTVPYDDFVVKVRKNGTEWTEQTDIEVCNGDEIDLKVELPIDPLLWLDAMNVSDSELTEGALVDSWKDLSGNGYSISADQEELYPSYSSTGMNGLPAVMFGMNDNADGLRLFTTEEDDFMENDWTMVIVGQELGTGRWTDVIGNKTESKYDDGWFLRFSKDGKSEISAGGAYYGGKTYDLPFDFVAVMSKSGRNVTLSINGEYEQSLTMEDGENITTAYEIFLGLSDKGNSGSARFHKGPISELMFFDHAIDEGTQRLIEGYLSQKWKLGGGLPAFHTYSNGSPLDITLEVAQGPVVQLSAADNSYSYVVDQFSQGQLLFFQNRSDCQIAQKSVEVSYGMDPFDVPLAISYDLDGLVQGNATEVYIQEGQNLTLTLNTTTEGFQWERPDGTQLAEGEIPVLTAMTNDSNIGNWKAHILYEDVCYEGLERSLIIEVVYSDSPVHVINVQRIGNGSLSSSGVIQVLNQDQFNLSVSSDAGNKLIAIILDGVSQEVTDNFGEEYFYSLPAVSADHELTFTFEPLLTHTVEVVSEGNGGVSELGQVWVLEDRDLTLTFTPDPFAYLESVLLDGVEQLSEANDGEEYVLTLGKIHADYQVQAVFKDKVTYNVNLIISEGGGSKPGDGTHRIVEGENWSVSFYPYDGYDISDVKLDGVSLGVLDELLIERIASNHEIEVFFEEQGFTIVSTAGDHGTINPEGAHFYRIGSEVTYTFEPEAGYEISDVQIDGISKGAKAAYKFVNISSDRSIHVEFKEIKMYSIVASSGANGSISPSGESWFELGESVSYSIMPDLGYEILDVMLDGISQGPVDKLTFESIDRDHSIEASFGLILGIGDEASPISVYPNPSTGDFNLNTARGINQIEIYDLNGRRVEFSHSLDNKHINVRGMDQVQGILILTIHLDDGEITRERIIISR